MHYFEDVDQIHLYVLIVFGSEFIKILDNNEMEIWCLDISNHKYKLYKSDKHLPNFVCFQDVVQLFMYV